jgi:hypothetical protein
MQVTIEHERFWLVSFKDELKKQSPCAPPQKRNLRSYDPPQFL